MAITKDAPMRVEQTRHAFHFGSSITQAWRIHDHPKYNVFLKHFANLFNYATVGFYWDWHEKEPGNWHFATKYRGTFRFDRTAVGAVRIVLKVAE